MMEDVNSSDYVEVSVGEIEMLGTLHTKTDSLRETRLLYKFARDTQVAFGDVESLNFVPNVSENGGVVSPAASKIQ